MLYIQCSCKSNTFLYKIWWFWLCRRVRSGPKPKKWHWKRWNRTSGDPKTAKKGPKSGFATKRDLALLNCPIPAFPVLFYGFWAAPDVSAVWESPNSTQKSVALIWTLNVKHMKEYICFFSHWHFSRKYSYFLAFVEREKRGNSEFLTGPQNELPFFLMGMITRRSIGTILHVYYLQLQIIEGFNNPIYGWVPGCMMGRNGKYWSLGTRLGKRSLGKRGLELRLHGRWRKILMRRLGVWRR